MDAAATGAGCTDTSVGSARIGRPGGGITGCGVGAFWRAPRMSARVIDSAVPMKKMVSEASAENGIFFGYTTTLEARACVTILAATGTAWLCAITLADSYLA